MTAPVVDWERLRAAAREAMSHAYAPYSKFPVGAAALVDDGRLVTGCNVENASYGLGICAERSAVVQMVAAGEHDPVALVVVTPGPVLGTPCGACRQTLAEFARDLPVRLMVEGNVTPARTTSLEALLPDAFRADALAKG